MSQNSNARLLLQRFWINFDVLFCLLVYLRENFHVQGTFPHMEEGETFFLESFILVWSEFSFFR